MTGSRSGWRRWRRRDGRGWSSAAMRLDGRAAGAGPSWQRRPPEPAIEPQPHGRAAQPAPSIAAGVRAPVARPASRAPPQRPRPREPARRARARLGRRRRGAGRPGASCSSIAVSRGWVGEEARVLMAGAASLALLGRGRLAAGAARADATRRSPRRPPGSPACSPRWSSPGRCYGLLPALAAPWPARSPPARSPPRSRCAGRRPGHGLARAARRARLAAARRARRATAADRADARRLRPRPPSCCCGSAGTRSPSAAFALARRQQLALWIADRAPAAATVAARSRALAVFGLATAVGAGGLRVALARARELRLSARSSCWRSTRSCSAALGAIGSPRPHGLARRRSPPRTSPPALPRAAGAAA